MASTGNGDILGERTVEEDDILERYVVTSRGEYLGEHDETHIQARTEVELTGTELLTALDNTLTFAATTRQFVVNFVTVRYQLCAVSLADQ